MAGKKKIEGKEYKTNWGGARANQSGRPRIHLNKKEASQATKTEYRVVYKLTNNYVGSTNNLHRRMLEHKSVGVNPIDSVEVLFASYDKLEANKVERYHHSIGFIGGGKKYK